jgi:hypothetical protein
MLCKGDDADTVLCSRRDYSKVNDCLMARVTQRWISAAKFVASKNSRPDVGRIVMPVEFKAP